MTFNIKRGATAPAISGIVSRRDGTVVDLTGASAVFRMRLKNGETVVDAPALITDAAAGAVEYQWAVGDTDTVGVYQADFRITLSTGKLLVLPVHSFVTVTVYPDVEAAES